MVNANAVDEQELEAEYRQKILGEIVEAAEVTAIPISEDEPESNESNRFKLFICLVVTAIVAIVVLVLALTLPHRKDESKGLSVPPEQESTPSIDTSSTSEDEKAYTAQPTLEEAPIILPPTLETIKQRGSLICRPGDQDIELGFGLSLELVGI